LAIKSAIGGRVLRHLEHLLLRLEVFFNGRLGCAFGQTFEAEELRRLRAGNRKPLAIVGGERRAVEWRVEPAQAWRRAARVLGRGWRGRAWRLPLSRGRLTIFAGAV
jgi:hypothetical protein